MNILIVSATPFEIGPLVEYLTANFTKNEDGSYQKAQLRIQTLVTGVGMTATAFHVGTTLQRAKFDIAINAGIAGALNLDLKIGDVVNVISEQFGDLGVEENDGSFTDVHEMGLIERVDFPFEKGKIINDMAGTFGFLKKAKGLTINKVHGTAKSIALIKSKYDCDVESMEGAGFFYACKMSKTEFLEIRAISNFVEPRNRNNWDLPTSINNLNKVLVEMIEGLQ